MNCLAIEQREGIVVVDVGIGFPHDDVGVQLEHPDFSWLVERRDRVSGVFITHGHEDHIGAVPHLLRALGRSLPVYGPPHARALMERRFEEHGLDTDALVEVSPGGRYDVGPFDIEPIAVSHSIIDATGLAVRTVAGTIVHTGDFDLDPVQPAGEPIDGARFEALGDEGVRLLLSDSTNVDVDDRRGSEGKVAEALERIVCGASERVVVALFASNIHRLKMLGKVAEQTGRRLCLFGRSLQNQYEAARQIGRLAFRSDLLVAPERAQEVPREKLLVLAGGTQAEVGSALRRLASNQHQHLTLEPGDSVVLSSRIIPGNDLPVYEMMNDLLRLGMRVHSRITDPDVHTSGHAARSEQERMLEWVRPQAFLPVHGTLHHLRKHAALALDMGVNDALVVENGTPVLLSERGALEADEPVRSGRVRVTWGGKVLDEATRRRRVDMARLGLALVTVVVSRKRRLLETPRVTTHGVPTVDEDRVALRRVEAAIIEAIERASEYRMESLEVVIERATRRELFELSGVRPLIDVHLVERE
jgi:ribonuclease J